MLTLAICRQTKQRGFTLLEILLVLVITGLIVGITVPQMGKVMERTRIDAERRTIVTQLESLGFRAYAAGKSILIPAPESKIENPEPFPFLLPEGWRLTPDKDLNYAVNGVCTGATLTVTTPDQRAEQWRLNPPLCRAEPLVPGG